MHRKLHTPDIPPPPPLACTEMNSIYYDAKLMEDIFWSAPLLLFCTWRHGGHFSKPCPFFGNKNLFSCKFFAKKILLFWPPTWPPCHVVANQELLDSNFFFYFGQKPPSAIWVLLLKLLAKMYKPRAYKSYFTVNCMLWRQQTCEHTLNCSLPRHERFQKGSRSKRGVGQTYP